MDAEFLTQHHHAVAGLHHVAACGPAHVTGSAFDVIEGTTRTLGRIRKPRLKGCCFGLEVYR
jgi:hypothetical protein